MSTNYNRIIKTAIGGAIGAGLSSLIDTQKSEHPIQLIGAAILLGQAATWLLPSLVGRCCTREAAPQPQPVEAPDHINEDNDPELTAALLASTFDASPFNQRLFQALANSREVKNEEKGDIKDTDLARALRESKYTTLPFDQQLAQALANSREVKDEKKQRIQDTDLARAIQLSTRGESQYVKICTLQRAYNAKGENDKIDDDEIIPPGFEFAAGNNSYYHAGNLVIGLLSRDQAPDACRDPLGKTVSQDQLNLLANMMGISEEFLNIWWFARDDSGSEHIDADQQAMLKTDYRYKHLKGLLENSPEAISKKYLKFFKTKGIQAFN